MYTQQRRLDPLNPSGTNVEALIAKRDFGTAMQVATLYEDIQGDQRRRSLRAEIFRAQNRIADAIVNFHALPPFDWSAVRGKAWLLNAIGMRSAALRYMADVTIPSHAAGGAWPLLRELGRLDEVDEAHLDYVPRSYLQAEKILERYANGDRDSALDEMRNALATLSVSLDTIEQRFGNDHVPGHMFRVEAPISPLLMARLSGEQEVMHRLIRKVRFTLNNGGTLEVPEREHLFLLMAAALEHDHDEAVRQLDLARQTGLRNTAMLAFFGLVDDPYGLFAGLTEDSRYQALISAIDKSNEATVAELRTRLPELFEG